MAPETPKGVSSRLLSMKFMQRAAASAASTPGSDSDASAKKKRKLGSDDQFSANIDQASIQAAIDERESKRQAAIDRQGGNDTHWVLSPSVANSKTAKQPAKQPRRVVYVGYGDADPSSSDDEADVIEKPARTSTKGYAKSKEPEPETKDESDSEEDDSEDDKRFKPSGRAQGEGNNRSRSRSRSESRPTPEASKAKEFRDKRKKKEVKLNKLTSISSSGGNQFGSPTGNKGMSCYNCQKTGHKATDCPNKGSKGSKRG